ncbi:MAG: SPOR domain-containing protein [Desulfovibrio sp.]|nr:SPOR domain-containing protein [Desulfovibrio sp.]
MANSNNAISSLGKKSETEQDDKILAPEELRFARVLRNESVVADAPQKPQAQTQSVMAQSAATASDLSVNKVRTPAGAGITASPPIDKQQVSDIQPAMYDFVFQVGAFKDEDTVDAIRQRLEGRGLRTRMQRSGKLYVVLVLLRGDATRAGEVQRATESLGLGKPIQRSRKPVLQP